MMVTRKGFTLMELAMVTVVVAIIVIAATPDSGTAARQEGMLAAWDFETDVAYARSLGLALPDDPMVIRVDAANNKYWLAKASATETPINHPQTGRPYVAQFGASTNRSLKNVQIVASDFGGDALLRFDSLGNTDQATAAVVQFQSAGAKYEISVAPAAAQTTVQQGFSRTLTAETYTGIN